MNKDPRAIFESWDQTPKYVDAVFVRPVVEDGPEEVDVCADGLLGEEVTDYVSMNETYVAQMRIDLLCLESNSVL
jgi:hypothetical protein